MLHILWGRKLPKIGHFFGEPLGGDNQSYCESYFIESWAMTQGSVGKFCFSLHPIEGAGEHFSNFAINSNFSNKELLAIFFEKFLVEINLKFCRKNFGRDYVIALSQSATFILKCL